MTTTQPASEDSDKSSGPVVEAHVAEERGRQDWGQQDDYSPKLFAERLRVFKLPKIPKLGITFNPTPEK